jgi:hypothetical protein
MTGRRAAGTESRPPDPLLEQVTVQKQYYTLCMACDQAFGDFSDTLKEANKNRRHHLAWHRKQAKARQS